MKRTIALAIILLAGYTSMVLADGLPCPAKENINVENAKKLCKTVCDGREVQIHAHVRYDFSKEYSAKIECHYNPMAILGDQLEIPKFR